MKQVKNEGVEIKNIDKLEKYVNKEDTEDNKADVDWWKKKNHQKNIKNKMVDNLQSKLRKRVSFSLTPG